MVLSDKDKYDIVIRNENGQCMKYIANDMNINIKTVNKWITKYKKDNNIERKKISGNLKKTTIEEDQIILDEIKQNNRLAAKNIQNNIKNKNINISKNTVINRLHEYNFSYKIPQTKLFLTN
jgi:transposase